MFFMVMSAASQRHAGRTRRAKRRLFDLAIVRFFDSASEALFQKLLHAATKLIVLLFILSAGVPQ